MPRDDENDGLGPLPLKWEKAYTENGESYFIDHNTGTSHWLDPRLAKFQKKSLEDCNESELPYGWEKINDPQYGTYFIDHVNRRTQYENPVLEAKRRAERSREPSNKPNSFTRNPSELCGERLSTTLLKSSRGLGFTIVGGDDNVDEFLQIKSIVPNGPAWLDGKLETGDILVYVNETLVLGFTHHEMVNVFQSIQPGETVNLDVCRGYPLPFDPNDPNTEVVTTIAVDGICSDPEKARILMDFNMDGNYNFLDVSDTSGAVGGLQKNALSKLQNGVGKDGGDNYLNETRQIFDKPEILHISIVKGAAMGFGFTIADSAYGQKVKKILDSNCCKDLIEGDYLLAINNTNVQHMSHSEVVQVLKDCPKGHEAELKIQRGHLFNGNLGKGNRLRRSGDANRFGTLNKDQRFRSKTPTADLYSTQTKEILPVRPKTPLVDTRIRVKTPSNDLNVDVSNQLDGKNDERKADSKSNNSFPDHDSINNDIPFMDPFPKILSSLSDRLADTSIPQDSPSSHIYDHTRSNKQHFANDVDPDLNYDQQSQQDYNGYNYNHRSNGYNSLRSPPSPLPIMAPVPTIPTYHQESCYCYECQDYGRHQEYLAQYQYAAQGSNGRSQKRINDYMIDRRKAGFSPLESHGQILSPQSQQGYWRYGQSVIHPQQDEYTLSEVTLERQALGFGFRIVGGTEEGSQVTVGHIVPGGSADCDPRIATGDEILSIDGHNVVQGSHHRVVQLMQEAGHRGHVTMILRRKVTYYQQPTYNHRIYPYDVIISRNENEGFGFVISSSTQYYGSTIGKIIVNSPADRCDDLKVDDRIIAVNRIDISNMNHGDIVNLIKESGLHVRLTIGSPQEKSLGGPPPVPPPPQHSANSMVNSEQYFDTYSMAQHPQL
ncbi:hypothetical protein HA402_014103 [Bradysia odoriphaga]|nr:hypothetical protein HA402_014103 [Bradysia odoriphaga]